MQHGKSIEQISHQSREQPHLHICQLALGTPATCHADPWGGPCRGRGLLDRGCNSPSGLLPFARGPVPPWGARLGPTRGQAAGIGLGLVPTGFRFQSKVMQALLKY